MKKQLTGKHIGNGYLKVGFYMFKCSERIYIIFAIVVFHALVKQNVIIFGKNC